MERDEGRPAAQAARLLASIVESSDDAIVSKSLDGVIQTLERRRRTALRLHAPSEAVGRHISLIIPPERIAEEDQIIASLKAGQRIEPFRDRAPCAATAGSFRCP